MSSLEAAVSHIRDHYSMSDDQLAREHRLQKQWFGAIATLRVAAAELNAGSCCVEVDAESLENFIHDETPDQAVWSERIQENR
jgi:hypothetical protein